MLLSSHNKKLPLKIVLRCLTNSSTTRKDSEGRLSHNFTAKRFWSQHAYHHILRRPCSLNIVGHGNLRKYSSSIDNNESISGDNHSSALENEEILKIIRCDSLRRTQLRQKFPSEEWNEKHARKDMKFLMRQHLKNGRVSLAQLQKPLSIGDLVLVLERSLKLHIVVGLPEEINSNTYTFVNEDGDIIYGPKSCISLRVPSVIPGTLLKSLNLLRLEKKIPGIAPSGMPDSIFSRGDFKESLEINEKKTCTENELETPQQKANPAEVNLHNVGDELLVAQAASQFLTDTDVNTFIVPINARKFYDSALRDLSISVFKLIPKYMEKLDLLYKTLEKDKLDSLVFFEKSYSVFELFSVIQKNREVPDIRNINLAPKNILIADYIAFLCSLKRSCKTWKTFIQMSTMTPVRVSFRSKLDFLESESTKSFLTGDGMEEFQSFYINFQKNGGSLKIPRSIIQVTKVLESFVADGCAYDQTLASLVSTLIKKLDIRSKEEALLPKTRSFSVDDPRLRAHEILTSLSGNYNQCPVPWLETSKIPHTETSVEADYFADYHKYINNSIGPDNGANRDISEKDPLSKVRKYFGNTPIYCIDSAKAHEIDDGISIKHNDSHFVITVHVANPTSYILPQSQLSKISYMMGSTSYSPEGPVMMLPKLISEKSGLGGSETNTTESTRTLAIEFEVDKAAVLAYIDQVRSGNKNYPSDEIAETVQNNVFTTVKIKAYHASYFPKNFTYEKVNEILNNENNIKEFNAGNLRPTSHELNLFYLYHISSILRHIRVGLGSGLEISAPQSTVSVDFTEQKQPNLLIEIDGGWAIPLERSKSGITPIVSIKCDADQGFFSKSQQLVSNFMITANYAGAHFAEMNKIPFIYKRQSLALSPSVNNTVKALNRQAYEANEPLSPELQLNMISILTKAYFSTDPGIHESLGVKSYLNLTSPLRRYVDLINHYNLQLYLTGKKCETKKDLTLVTEHLQACENNSRISQRFANKFWTCKFLERYFELLSLGKIKSPISLSFVLRSDAKYGDVKASILEFPGINVTITQNDYIIKNFAKREFYVGFVTKTNFRVQSLDFINGEMVVEFLENCT